MHHIVMLHDFFQTVRTTIRSSLVSSYQHNCYAIFIITCLSLLLRKAQS